MSEITPEPTEVDVTDETLEDKQNFITRFAVKHPRTAKVVAITGAVTAAAGVALTVNNVRKNRHHLEAAGDHAKETLRELADTVSPTDADV